jgi:hypothetical protein
MVTTESGHFAVEKTAEALFDATLFAFVSREASAVSTHAKAATVATMRDIRLMPQNAFDRFTYQ